MLTEHEIRLGVRDALMAAAEEHDRDADEVICPLNVAEVTHDTSTTLWLPDGRAFKVTVEEVRSP